VVSAALNSAPLQSIPSRMGCVSQYNSGEWFFRFERLLDVLSKSYPSLAGRGLRHFGFCAAAVAVEVGLGRVGFVEPDGGELSMLSKGRADREIFLFDSFEVKARPLPRAMRMP
jgi:hypothetical protein